MLTAFVVVVGWTTLSFPLAVIVGRKLRRIAESHVDATTD